MFNFLPRLILDTTCSVDMNGVRFYGGSPFAQAANSYTFGSQDSPTYVLIGFIRPTFTPMLLAYGVVTLSINRGINFSNFVSWTVSVACGPHVHVAPVP